LRVSPYLHGRLNDTDAGQDQRSKHRPVDTFAEPSRTKNRSQAMGSVRRVRTSRDIEGRLPSAATGAMNRRGE
jgi:hypothetical protein